MAVYQIKKRIVKPILTYSNTFENFVNNVIINSKTIIVRGIGYRAFNFKNTLLHKNFISNIFIEKMRPIYTGAHLTEDVKINSVSNWELSSSRYLIIRAGHTRDAFIPLHKDILCVTNKKDRKLTVGSKNCAKAVNLVKKIFSYRPPSAYTGRGVRIKHEKIVRKAGKKDKQKGRAF